MVDTSYPSLSLATRSKEAELERHRRARAGDTKAQAEIDAKEVRIDVDNATRSLFERARGGDQAALAAMKAIAGGKAPSGSSAAGVPTTSKVDVQLAEQAATARERRRMAEVFASPHSRGRERGCATLLSSTKGWSASEIVKELPHLPKDGQQGTSAGRAKADAVWDTANATVGRTKAPAEAKASGSAPKPGGKSSDPWERAYASVGRRAPK